MELKIVLWNFCDQFGTLKRYTHAGNKAVIFHVEQLPQVRLFPQQLD
jgi:hypothetical protein